ncbi:hypothetical protein DL240_04710 [Lujinxingia litoralis]|uniref:HEAT repeat domain-containing protein n=1 Tax=Lujinxingia litoralis TaxID=2211119 RepID=A0A328CAL0_9DELT|nr:HEAT repeat domain-containing protein [Lujinxingia litoralis]RAL25515.1 hypothetical protein DL240_04710 [Lujinxingia litoralis]
MIARLAHISNSQARHREFARILHNQEGSEAERRALCLASLDDPYPPVRQEAAHALGDLMSPEVVELLAYWAGAQSPPPQTLASLQLADVALDWASPRARVGTLAALRRAPLPQRSAEVAADLLDDPHADVRYQALVTLYRVAPGHPALNQHLEALLHDPDSELAVTAAQILVDQARADALPALVQTWTNARRDRRLALGVAIAELIGSAGLDPAELPPHTRDTLITELSDALRTEAWLSQAARALALLDGQRASDALHTVIERWFAHPLLKLDAAAALVDLGDARGADHIARMLSSRRKDARGYALRLVGAKKIARHFDHLVKLATSDDYHADTALLALADYASAEARQVLETLAQTHPDPELRELASEGLRLGQSPEPIAPQPAARSVDGAP